MSHWALGADPRLYRLADAVRERERDVWFTGGRGLSAGDLVAIYKFKGRDAQRGVLAFGRVLSDPTIRPDESPYWVDPPHRVPRRPSIASLRQPAERVDVEYIPAPNLPLWVGSNPDSVVNELSVTRTQGGTAFHITDAQWQRLIDEAGGLGLPDVIDDAAPLAKGVRRGQQFAASAEVRRAVELRAMEAVMSSLSSDGWDVTDVSMREPYDIHCRKTNEFLRVEVKGSQATNVSHVFLTAAEVSFASADPKSSCLAVVAGIRIAPGHPMTGVGGEVTFFRPWQIDTARLIPMAFRYSLG